MLYIKGNLNDKDIMSNVQENELERLLQELNGYRELWYNELFNEFDDLMDDVLVLTTNFRYYMQENALSDRSTKEGNEIEENMRLLIYESDNLVDYFHEFRDWAVDTDAEFNKLLKNKHKNLHKIMEMAKEMIVKYKEICPVSKWLNKKIAEHINVMREAANQWSVKQVYNITPIY